ncbi:polyphosphate kinase 1 [Ruminococcus sp.]|uniref:polyphosphate kinase 1 n=1 Tax=Ruminococcus sp. TaxID=41978 RepID=UPI0025D91D79|nr:polyphosphate kinase 1 [Ruminococcus sp.]MBQ8965293.1 polyphosphate kinase 1 [Ruminococcus sp.]
MKNRVYDNRELSWLKFNERVLEEARDERNPLLERLLFQSIYGSNLDEFFMVRVGSLYDASLVDDSNKDNKSKMKPSEQLSAIFARVRELIAVEDESFKAIHKALEPKNIMHKSMKNLTIQDLEFLEAYYAYEIKPFLNAIIIDKRHPFPFLANKSIYVAAKLTSKSGITVGLIGCSEKFDRVIFLPRQDDTIAYVLVEELIYHFTDKIFPGYKVEEKTLIRVTRNADIDVDESFDRELDFRQNMSVLINKRKRLCPVRLQLSRQISEPLLKELCTRLELSKKQVFVEKTPLDLSYVFTVFDKAESRKELFFEPQSPQLSRMIDESRPMIEQVDERNLFLSYPYESIQPFIRMLNEAAKDDSVVSIKMTLYRVAKHSKVVKALCAAAENGKEVVVLVELRARFDEENNIGWSKQLEEAGCRVMYGPKGLKVHSKLCLITRKTADGVKYTTQIGTGNYNEKTAGLYTDLCLMTSNEQIAREAEEVFRTLSIGELVEDSRLLLVAPHCLQNRVLEMMDNEIAIAKAGGEGYVGAKLNSLTDKVIIDKLIECSQAGVKVEMMIRGISCLVAGVAGVTENIRIRSIVGRYLEHARIYIFGSGVRKNVYISSADYMTRNTTRRVEVAAPVLDEDIKKRILDLFDTQMNDNVKARDMQPDGTYLMSKHTEPAVDAQGRLFAEAYANVPKPKPKPQPAPEPVALQEEKSAPEEVQPEPKPEGPVKKKACGQGSSRYSVVKVKVKKKK